MKTTWAQRFNSMQFTFQAHVQYPKGNFALRGFVPSAIGYERSV